MSLPLPDGPVPQPMPATPRVSRFRPVVIATLAVAVAASVWLVAREVRKSKHHEICRAHLRQIGAALQAYHNRYESFPPAYVAGPTGQPFHSWRVLLLPFLGQQELYDKYHFDEPWNGPRNRALAQKMPHLFACPASGSHRPGVTNYLAIVGRQTAWPEQYSVRRRDFVDGTANTIQVVESSDSDILWTEPRDLTYRQALACGQPVDFPTPSSRHRHKAEFSAVMADGTVRFISNQIRPEILRSVLSINGGRALAGVEWPHADLPEPTELPAPRPASELLSTDVLPYPTGAITRGRNYVYCAAFEIAWDDASRALGDGPIVLSGDPFLARELNGHRFDRRNLSSDSYLARGGPGTTEFREQLRQEMARKFPKSAVMTLNQIQDEHVLLLYAYLLKSLRFETVFDALPEPLLFRTADGEKPVRSFGIRRLDDADARGEQLQAQVRILDYRSDDDFVLQLAPAESHDEIVLAKVKPADTLGETVVAVRHRISRPHAAEAERRIVNEETLVIPRLVVSAERRYSEIVDRDIAGTKLYISEAVQVLRFGLDETGALLESEVAIVGDDEPGGGRRSPVGQRKFVFDRPFLVYLIERDADQPYFVAWVENAELMEPAGR